MFCLVSVQEEAIPEGLAGNDLVAQAKAGMGKTAVYVVVTLERINVADGLQCIVMVHTRELAYQVCRIYNCGANLFLTNRALNPGLKALANR